MVWAPALAFLIGCGDGGTLTFASGDKATVAAPVVFPWPNEWGVEPVSLKDDVDRFHAVQRYERNGSAFGFCIAPALPPRRQAAWKVESSRLATPGGVELTKTEDGVAVKIDGELFTTFVTKRIRKPILWPLFGPKGEKLTQTGPRDHIHHRSFWFTHGKVNGHDFWSELPRAGKTVLANLHPLVSGPVFGEISCDVDWIAKDGAKVCTDRRTMRFYRTSGVRMIDFEIAFKPTNGDLVFGDDKEGTFGVRVAPTMSADQPKGSPPGGTLVNAEGLKNAAVWGRKSPWCDYSGPTDGGVAGIAILDHPSNLRHPTTWHARTYGLFCANPFGLSYFVDKKQNGEHRVPMGSEFKLRYRIVLHSGDAAAAEIPKHFAAFAEPPTVAVQ